jgi:murein hydrolase activator
VRRRRAPLPAAPPAVALLAAALSLAVLLAALPPSAAAQDAPAAPAAGAPGAAAAAPALGEKRQQIHQLGKERSQAEQQLARIQANEGELRLEVEQLSELVRESLQRKEALEQRIRRQQELAEQQGREAKRLEGEVREGQKRIGQRLRRLYRLAKQGRTALLFQMARFQTFAKDTRSVALLQESDRAAIARFESLAREMVEQQHQAELSVQRLIALRGELEDETRQLSDRQAYLHQAMSDISNNRALYRKYLAEVEQMMTRMEVAVTRMEKDAQTAAPPPKPRTPSELHGALPPPVPGEVIAAFGAQDPRYDLKKRQRGIVLRVAPKAAVTAVAAGRAVHAGPFRGYQQLVVLDHGQGLFTVYGHLEALTVKRGDWVAQGTTLGVATYQPVDEAYDVYFEIRHNGKPDDPLGWLKAGSLRVSASAAAP